MALKLFAKINDAVIKSLTKKLKNIEEELFPSTDASTVGDQMVNEMKAMISRGISPIKGSGRFPQYKNPKDGYPASVRKKYPEKRTTPVNLRLTGKMLEDLSASASKHGITIGYSKEKEILKEQGHRDGVNGQPSRPTIPVTRKGEEFALRVQDIFLKALRKNLKKL